MQVAHRESEKRAIRGEIGTEQDTAGFDAGNPQSALKQPRRNVQHRDRIAHERQRRRQPLESLGITRHGEVACSTPRGSPQLRQVHGQSLLQLARPTRGDQGRPWGAATDVDQKAGTVRLRAGASKRGSRCPRSTFPANGGDENDLPVHRSAGLA